MNPETSVKYGKGEEPHVVSKRDYYDFLAPSVHHLQTSVLSAMEENGYSMDSSLYDLENLRSETPGLIRQKGVSVECPIDHRVGAAYVHCLEAEGQDQDHFGTATHMLSYAWGYKMRDIVDTLVDFCKTNDLDPKRTYVWICAFCNNQHRVVERNVTFEEFEDIFHKRVEGIGNVLAMMTPWDDPAYIKRVWCVFEMYSAKMGEGTNLQIIMPPDEKRSLMNAVLKPTDQTGKSGLDDLFTALASTKVQDAQATSMQDKLNILKLVEDGPGFEKFNIEINQFLRAWIENTVLESAIDVEEQLNNNKEEDQMYTLQETATYLTFCASFFSRIGAHQKALELHTKGLKIYEKLGDNENAKELMARCYNNMGTEYESLGKYEEALENHHKCRDVFEEIYGNEHENTSVSYFNIGAVLKKLGKPEEALKMYEKSMEIDTRIKGENHIDVGLSLSYIGRVKQGNEDYEGALDNFRKSLKIRQDTFGNTHPDTAVGYGDMGLLHHMRKEYDEAIEYHKKAFKINEQIVGDKHPDTASIYQNLGGAYYEKGLMDDALKYHKKAHKAYMASFGADHPKTKTSVEWINIVEDAMS